MFVRLGGSCFQLAYFLLVMETRGEEKQKLVELQDCSVGSQELVRCAAKTYVYLQLSMSEQGVYKVASGYHVGRYSETSYLF